MGYIYDIHGSHRTTLDASGAEVAPPKSPSYGWHVRIGNKVLAYSGAVLGHLIGVALFIPIVITITALSAIQGKSLQGYAGRHLALPSQKYDKKKLNNSRETFLASPPEGIEKVIRKKTHGIDTCAIVPEKLKNIPAKEQKWLVLMTGRRGAYEFNLERNAGYAKGLGVGILSFNWKGVGESDGRTLTAKSMEKDGINAVQHLLDQGVDAENICIIGHSLGGGVGAATAKHFQDQGQTVNFVNDRSFASSLDVVSTHLDWIPGLKPGVSFLTRLWWDVNAIDNFLPLKGFVGVIYSQDDLVIPYHTSSLYHRFKARSGEKPQYRMRIHGANGLAVHSVVTPVHVLKEFLQPFVDGSYKQTAITDVGGHINLQRDFTLTKAVFFSAALIGYLGCLALFIPITISLVALSFLRRWSFQECVARIVIPAQSVPASELDAVKNRVLKGESETVPLLSSLEEVTVNAENVETAGGFLDGVSCIPDSMLEVPKGEQKWMIVLKGRRGGYEDNLAENISHAREMGVGVLSCNWKGVGHSEGKTLSVDSMEEDAKAMLQHLVDRGVQPENICFYGRSLGANIAVKAANATGAACIADRGVSSAQDVVRHFHGIGWLPGVNSLVSAIANQWWDVDAAEDFQNMSSFKAICYSKEDAFIHCNSSLYTKVKKIAGKPEHAARLLFPPSSYASSRERFKCCLTAHCNPIPSSRLKELLQPWLS